MKQSLSFLIIALSVIFTSCSKDDEPTEQSFAVNVYTKSGSQTTLAEKSWLFLFKDNGKTIDKVKTASSIVLKEEITYSDGTTQSYEYSRSAPGVFNLENIPNDNYILLVTCSNYSFTYSSCKKITVDYNYRGTIEQKIFSFANSMTDGMFNYQEW